MAKYRKKPVVIEAVQWDGTTKSAEHVAEFMGRATGCLVDGQQYIVIATLEDGPDAKHYASPGDWIIRGVKGEFYPCKPDIFAATYEAVDDC